MHGNGAGAADLIEPLSPGLPQGELELAEVYAVVPAELPVLGRDDRSDQVR